MHGSMDKILKKNIFANLLLLLIYLMYSQASKSKLQLDLLQVLI